MDSPSRPVRVQRALARATVIFGIALGARAAGAQTPETPVAPVPAGAAAHPPRAWDLAVLPLIYYQPETSLGAVGQVVLVRTASSGSATEERHDTLSASVTATLRSQYAFGISGTKFWNQDHDRLKVDVGIQRFPNTFWGLGNDTPTSAADQYTPLSVGAQPNYSHRVVERIFVGMNAVGGYYRLQSFAPGGPVADYLATRRREGRLIGIGPTVVRDSRDDSNYPRAGSLTALTLTAYLPAWLSEYRFAELKADQRTFISLPLSSVLALQAFGQMVIGEPPIDALPALGGPAMLRGFFQGRYRDKVYMLGQAEWRVPLFWRLGAALFGATGDVFPDLAHVGGENLKAAGGLGLRINVASRNPVNIRLDGAFASGSSGVYLVIGEAI
jgi:outer membrane protein assembly factor BamA